MKWFLYLVVVGLVLECLACPCTMADCSDRLGLWIHPTRWPMEPVTIKLEFDGKTITCANLLPNEALQVCGEDRNVGISFPPKSCSGCFTSDDAIGIGISEAPESITASFYVNDVLLGTHTFEPNYKIVEPNGAFCSPTCREWTETWEM